MRTICGVLFLSFFFLGAIGSRPAAAIPAGSAENSSTKTGRGLLLLRLAEDEAGRAREERLKGELLLVLDQVPITAIDMRGQRFLDKTLNDQIQAIEPLFQKHDVLAVTWLAPVSEKLLLLNMVAISSGQAMVRLVEAKPSSGFEADLALQARELLGGAFLFHDLPKVSSGALRTVVGDVLKKALPEPDRAKARRLIMAASALICGPIYGQTGLLLEWGGRLAIGAQVIPALRIDAAFSVCGGSITTASKEHVFALEIGPSLRFAYLFAFKRLSLGPFLDAKLRFTTLNADVEPIDASIEREASANASIWSFAAAAGLESRYRFYGPFEVVLSAGLVWAPVTERFYRQSTDLSFFRTPRIGWEGALGLAIDLTIGSR